MSLPDKDGFVTCPYNPAHRMLRKRLQSHLFKCKVNYPNILLQKCPFNGTHMMREQEFVHHVTTCPDRKLMDQYKIGPPVQVEERPIQQKIECSEDWDDDKDYPDYNPLQYAENAKIIRQPLGIKPAERKEFVKSERKRQGVNSDEDEDVKILRLPRKTIIEEVKYRPEILSDTTVICDLDTKPPTPPPPAIGNWSISPQETAIHSHAYSSTTNCQSSKKRTMSRELCESNAPHPPRVSNYISTNSPRGRAENSNNKRKRCKTSWDNDMMSPERF